MLKKPRVLISGDSFAADSSCVIDNSQSWTQLLKERYTVTNVAQAGAGEYKILKQLQNTNVNQFDYVIVVHTSPNRVYIKEHPLHYNNPLHKNCDLIYNDILNSGSKDIVTTTAINYFKYIFDEAYYADIHQLLVKEIFAITNASKVLHISFFKNLDSNILDWSDLWAKNTGNINHLNAAGNVLVLDKVTSWISQHS